uniref:ATP synthase complex subunit 8 n=1 Tax=Pselaphinae sp. 3 EF-2015 TaxID=1756857 RepID=A0A0S2M8I6_9COLE|nr:ATP synthase F0 subunit 8 [Pselaphinae sp. 3 EF-2015]
MPQMSPMNWILLYLFFSFIFIMFNFLNYYYMIYNIKFNKNYKIMNKLNWKW